MFWPFNRKKKQQVNSRVSAPRASSVRNRHEDYHNAMYNPFLQSADMIGGAVPSSSFDERPTRSHESHNCNRHCNHHVEASPSYDSGSSDSGSSDSGSSSSD